MIGAGQSANHELCRIQCIGSGLNHLVVWAWSEHLVYGDLFTYWFENWIFIQCKCFRATSWSDRIYTYMYTVVFLDLGLCISVCACIVYSRMETSMPKCTYRMGGLVCAFYNCMLHILATTSIYDIMYITGIYIT